MAVRVPSRLRYLFTFVILAVIACIGICPHVAWATEQQPTSSSIAAVDNGIPVLSLTIDPDEYQKVIESEDHSYRSNGGSISIVVPHGYTGEFSETELQDLADASLEYIRGRGNSTWVSEKKPFKFKYILKDLLIYSPPPDFVFLMSYFTFLKYLPEPVTIK